MSETRTKRLAPLSDHSHLATKEDLRVFGTELRAELRVEFRTDLAAQVARLRKEFDDVGNRFIRAIRQLCFVTMPVS